MMYPFLTLDDQTEIVHSQLLDDGSVKVYVEKPDAKDGFQILIIPAQIAVNAVFQLGALQNTVCFLRCGRSGILKIAPAGIQYALYGAKISFQLKTSYKDSKRERSISTAFPRSCFSRRILFLCKSHYDLLSNSSIRPCESADEMIS